MIIRAGPNLSVFGADYSRGHGVVQAKGITDGHYPFANFELVRISERSHRKIPSANFDKGNVYFLVFSHHLSRQFPPVQQPHGYLLGVVHYMVIGQNQTVWLDDEAGAEAPLLQLFSRGSSAKSIALAERIRRVQLLGSLGRGNIHN